MSIINGNSKWMKIFSPLAKDNISLFLILLERYWKVNRSRKCSLTCSCQYSGERFCFDGTCQSRHRDENERKPGDPGVPALIYGEHRFMSFQFLPWCPSGESMGFGKEFCEEVFISKSVLVNIIMGRLGRLLIEHGEGDLSFGFLYTF